MTVISYPISAYQNVPIEPQFYQPSRFVISDIALGQTTIVTTTEDVNYVVGQLVRLIIPPSYGCRQLNEQVGYVLSLPTTTQIELSIYSSGGDAYINSSATTKAQTLAVGNINLGATNSNGPLSTSTYIPASFINISPI